MAFNKVWERIHAQRAWGKYPKEELVRWAFRVIANTDPSELTALDLGCGQGAASWFLAREGFNVVAVDGSVSALAKAHSRLSAEGLGFQSTACCLTSLPFADRAFDLVVDIVSSVHNSIQDVYTIFGEVARVMKPGGKLFSVMPTNKCSRHPFMDKGAINFMERQDVDHLLKKHFVNVSILRSSYQLDSLCTVENWIVTGDRQ